jgi:hypothetical protein
MDTETGIPFITAWPVKELCMYETAADSAFNGFIRALIILIINLEVK